MTEYGLAGTPVRTIGQLRQTGHEDDRELHLALNAGIPLADPDRRLLVRVPGRPAGLPGFDASGTLLFHRVMQGREIDPVVAAIPDAGRAGPTARDPAGRAGGPHRGRRPTGRLWVSFVVPYTYVYDALGEKVRTVQFRGAGMVSPAA